MPIVTAASSSTTRTNTTGRSADENKAIELDADYAEAYFDRGRAHYQLGKSEDALADFTAAIRLQTGSATFSYTWRGFVYDDLKNYDRALADYDKAIRLDPRDGEPYYVRGVTYDHQGDSPRAKADYRKAVKLDPGLPKD